jgi:probable F420-dependent oxidoreductase
VKFGIQMFPTDYAIPVTELGKACEDLGFDSLFFPEHTHIPTSRRTPWPGGAELPLEYSHTLDPFVAMGAVAAVTKRLLLGTGICLVIERDTITLAKEVASVDHLSGGRVLFGIGGGWNVEEMENHGTHYRSRWRRLREQVEALKAIWTQDEAEYHGKFVNFDPIWSWPKPVQKPHPPILVGGDGEGTLQRVIDYGDGWMPILRRDPLVLVKRIRELQAMAKAAGRGPIPVSIFGAPARPEVIELMADAGVERCIIGQRPVPADEALTALKRHAEVIARYS